MNNQTEFENEIQEKRKQIISESKQSGLYNFVEKTIEENKGFIESTLRKHKGKDWVSKWLAGKVNLNNIEFEKIIPCEKFSMTLNNEKIEYIVTFETILKEKYGVE